MLKKSFFYIALMWAHYSFSASISEEVLPDYTATIVDISHFNERKSHLRNGIAYPMIATFKKDGQTLRYIGSQHSENPFSPAHQLIRQEFAKRRPDCVVVEGFVSEKHLNEIIGSQQKWEEHGQYGEHLLTVFQARQNNIPIVRGDPSYAQEKDFFIEKGYSLEAVEYFFTLHSFAVYFNPTPSLSPDRLLHMRSVTIDGKEKSIEWVTGCKEWVKKIYGEDYLPWSPQVLVDAFPATPWELRQVRSGTPIEEMKLALLKFREHTIIARILGAMKEHKNVLVVFGGSHLLAATAEFEERFGPPSYQNYYYFPKVLWELMGAGVDLIGRYCEGEYFLKNIAELERSLGWFRAYQIGYSRHTLLSNCYSSARDKIKYGLKMTFLDGLAAIYGSHLYGLVTPFAKISSNS